MVLTFGTILKLFPYFTFTFFIQRQRLTTILLDFNIEPECNFNFFIL